MRHTSIHSDKTKFIPSMVCKSENRLLIVTGKRTFFFNFSLKVRSIKTISVLLIYGVMWYTVSKNRKWIN